VPVRIFTATESKTRGSTFSTGAIARVGHDECGRTPASTSISAREAKGRYRTVSKRKTPRTPTSMAALRQSVQRTQLTRTLSRAKAS
jgi:hypothetical protein